VIADVVERLLLVRGVGEVVVLVSAAQMDRVWALLGPQDRVQVKALERRPEAIDARIRIGRVWNALAWRGGAGQFTFFDEEYHPAAIAGAAAGAFSGTGAEHVLVVHSHGVFLDPELTGALVHHHLHKNHEMRVTYTPAAPGLAGMVLRADIVAEMGEKSVMPWQLLAYDPKQPIFDTLIREACMQVDPALSKIPNRFCVDTQRTWEICKALAEGARGSLADLCVAAARTVAPGVTALAAGPWPRELEIELTAARLTRPPGAIPAEIAARRTALDAAHWAGWFSRQGKIADDLLLTFGGDGDPLLYDGLTEVLEAARAAGPLSIGVQTDLASPVIDPLLAAISRELVDVVTISTYGHSAAVYRKVGGADLHAQVMRNMERLAEATRPRSGIPFVIPRLLKVRETIPEMEAFFDFWIERTGWAVIDAPTDRAGSVPFEAVVDMTPPKRKACRRIWDRMLIRADGTAAACDQDVQNRLAAGHLENSTVPQLWQGMQGLRDRHAGGKWNEIDPCRTCREWHRP
jgi:radical SAM protein with 4Fe4S-binding SPASM domain